MKRLLIWLLVFMLPAAAMAEACQIDLTIELEDGFAEEMQAAMLQHNIVCDHEAMAVLRLAQHLLDSVSLHITVQEDAVSVALINKDAPLLDVTIHMQEDSLLLTSDLLPGYAFALERNSSAQPHAEDEMPDWAQIKESLNTAYKQWASNIVPETRRGVYHGDTYTGGTQCTSITLGDMDIAALVDALATTEVREAAAAVLKCASLDAQALLARFDEQNDRVADEDRYLYFLRLVEDDEDQFRGLSIAVVEELSQVASASVGVSDHGLSVVAGLGLQEQNYWWQGTADLLEKENGRVYSGTFREWISDKVNQFSYVREACAPISEYFWQCELVSAEESVAVDGFIHEGADIETGYLASVEGQYSHATPAADISIGIGINHEKMITVRMQSSTCAEIPPVDESREVFSLNTEADADTYQTLLQRLMTSLLTRMMKVLPLEDILTWGQP